MMKKFQPSEEDQAIFRASVGPVEPLRRDRVEHARTLPPPIPRSTLADERQVIRDMVSDYFEPAEVDTGEELYHCREGVPSSTLRKLRRGRFKIGAELDLHGLTIPMAREALVEFIHHAQRDSITCVRIIHGKGNRSRHKGPVLKQKTNHWLRQRDDVLAFCSARPMDGGTGAIYVLLQRRL
jgi:DNA-nicking Smr family endonuclease